MKDLKLGYVRTSTVNGEVDIYAGHVIKPYEGRIEQSYEGLLESVRRVDNFPKPKITANQLSVEDILAMIDSRLVGLKQRECNLTHYDDDYIAGEVYGAMEELEFLKEDILEFKNKGE